MAPSTDSQFSARGRLYKSWGFGCIGEVRFYAGRVGEALTNYFLPGLSDIQARGISEKSTDDARLHDLMSIGIHIGMAYQQLQRLDESLPHLRKSDRLANVLANQYPNIVQPLWDRVVAGARLGELLVEMHESDEGFKLLGDSLKQIQELVARDPAIVSFRELHITVLQLNALAMAAWSRASSEPAEHQKRLDQAQAYLDQAEPILAALPTDSARIWPRWELETARSIVNNSR